MPEQIPGSVDVLDTSSKVAIHLGVSGKTAAATVGNSGAAGVLSLTNADGKENLRAEGMGGMLRLGGNGADGDLWVMPSQTTDATDTSQATIHLGGAAAVVQIGAKGKAGRLALRDATTANRLVLESDPGFIVLQKADGTNLVQLGSGSAPQAAILLFADNGKRTFNAEGASGLLQVGGGGQNGQIQVVDANGKIGVTISGASGGDLVLGGADCAEEFDMAEEYDPGTVVVLGDDERLYAATTPYDKRVAGVLSGAGSYRPALVMDKQGSRAGRKPLAMIGKVFCRVDAREKPIAVGDLLTTSSTRGHAMKADDPLRAFGAVIGKALRPCASGLSLIPILVALQ